MGIMQDERAITRDAATGGLAEAMVEWQRPRVGLYVFGEVEVRIVAAMIEDDAALAAARELIESEDVGNGSASEEIRRRLVAGWAVLPPGKPGNCPIEAIGHEFCDWSDFTPSGVAIASWLRLHRP